MAELVAWEGKDFKATRLELFVEGLQAVVLRCEATFRGNVDNQQYLATVVGETAFLARAQPGAEIVDRHSGCFVLATFVPNSYIDVKSNINDGN